MNSPAHPPPADVNRRGFVQLTFGWLAAAFVLFRVFDVIKPQPANWVQRWPGGWGITADDVAVVAPGD